MAELIGPRLYCCCNCRNHVALHDDVISKAFQVNYLITFIMLVLISMLCDSSPGHKKFICLPTNTAWSLRNDGKVNRFFVLGQNDRWKFIDSRRKLALSLNKQLCILLKWSVDNSRNMDASSSKKHPTPILNYHSNTSTYSPCFGAAIKIILNQTHMRQWPLDVTIRVEMSAEKRMSFVLFHGFEIIKSHASEPWLLHLSEAEKSRSDSIVKTFTDILVWNHKA